MRAHPDSDGPEQAQLARDVESVVAWLGKGHKEEN